MFGLVAGLWNTWMRKDECQVLLLGLESSGKTTLLERIKADFGSNTKPGSSFDPGLVSRTIGMNLGHIDLESRSLVIRDLGGMEGLRGLWEKYYTDTDVVVFVVDGVDTLRFDEARLVLEAVLAHRSLNGAPLLVAVNKQDMVGSPMRPGYYHRALGIPMREEDHGGHGDGLDSTSGPTREITLQTCSALKGTGIRPILEWVGGHRREKKG